MTRVLTVAAAMMIVASAAQAGQTTCRRWGGTGVPCAYQDTMKVDTVGQTPRLVFDLSALPKDAPIHHASFVPGHQGGQPNQPVRLMVVEKVDGEKLAFAGGPLELEKPYYRSFDCTAAVRAWVKDPARNLGLAAVSFDGLAPPKSYLEICYDGGGAAGPESVAGIHAVHRAGQTFIAWKELPLFQPAKDKVFYVKEFGGKDNISKEPCAGFGGLPANPAITLKDLRELQGLSVRGKKGPREMEEIKVLKKLPAIRYRVYRHSQPITSANIKDARLLGESSPCNAYVERMLVIVTQGEYYNPYELPDSPIPTWCIGEGKPLEPGEAFFVHTPQEAGTFYYAVTVMQDGVENMAAAGGANSLAQGVAEKPQTPEPVLQNARPNNRNPKGIDYYHAYWLAPPVANTPWVEPRRVIISRMPEPGEKLRLDVAPGAGDMFFGGGVAEPGGIKLVIEEDFGYSPELCYNEGYGTLRSYAECKVDYFSERYILAAIAWTRSKFDIDPARVVMGGKSHLGVRHFELFRVLYMGGFENDFDRKWNPGSGSLGGMLGPQNVALTVEGDKAWDALDMTWYLRKNIGKNVPFIVCPFSQPKDGNHGAEYGWQDDPKGFAALRETRQPHYAQWGGGGVSRFVSDGVAKLRWDKSVPAFSGCSLDNSPGNGDPDDGEPWGQINGYLFWQYEDIAEAADRWEMTVHLVPDAPANACRVDVTPRHCLTFKPAKGQKFSFTNTQLADNKVLGQGTVEADEHGLVTLRQITVTKGKNRLAIAKQ